MAVGSHGLPLIGTGDWNDGMDEVGAQGRGESVWLGWFLASLLGPFAALAESRGDRQQAVAYRAHVARLREALDAAWAAAAPLQAFGVRQRWVATVQSVQRQGYRVLDRPARWRLGEITVAWADVAP